MMIITALFLFVTAVAGQIPTINYTQCGFPFTYNGTVQYSCIQNIKGVTDVNNQYGCFQVTQANQFNQSRAGAICINQPAGYSCPVGAATLTVGSNNYPTTSVCGWYVIMQRYNISSFNWTQNWVTYRNGFSSPTGEDFWLGLEPMYQVTNAANYSLRVELKRASDNTWSSGEYWQFRIGDETSKYPINLDGWVGGDSMFDGFNPSSSFYAGYTQNRQKFSTYDADNDNNFGTLGGGSCSVAAGGVGWWYSNASCFWNMLSMNTMSSNVWPYGTKSGILRYPIMSVRLMIKTQP